MASNPFVVEVESLVKRFGSFVAVDHISFKVEAGRIFGFLGPNGSGKSTTIRMLCGILMPTSGRARVSGFDVIREPERIKQRIGYMSQRFGLYEDLTVIENIHFYADLYGVPVRERPERIKRLLSFSNLNPFTQRLAGNLSGGMKQKLGLACALVHTPEILFLDEPTCGVDPVSRRDFWRILYDLLKEQITIFVSTAYLDEAERCTRIGLIHRGNILMVDEPARIKESFSLPMLEVASPDTRAAKRIVAAINGVISVSMYGDRLHIGMTTREVRTKVLEVLQVNGVEVEGEREIAPSLEDVFIAKLKKEQ